MNFIFKFSYKAHFNEVKINIKEEKKKRDIFRNKAKLFNEAFYKISSFIVHI